MAPLPRRLLAALALAGCLVLLMNRPWLISAPPPASPSPPAAIQLKTIGFNDLGAVVREQTGQVVVLDAWATWCVPCMKSFPHLVQLQRKYAGKGLICMSVALDEKADHEKALAFLNKQEAAFPNYLLDTEAKIWQDRWAVNGPPVLFVFDRNNRRVAKFDTDDTDGPIDFDEVERLVQRLLAEPAPAH